jgi:polar amino acid transport system substrate-binding protein
MTRIPRVVTVAALAALTMGLSACASETPPASSPAPATATPTTTAPAEPTAPDVKSLTLTPGKLTIATGNPAYSPWVEDDDPASKKGFEAAVAYAVAERLGFADADVTWVRTSFDEAVAPGPKYFDLNLQQFSITDERKQAVDFSSPYYTTTQAIVTYAGSPVAGAKSLADLKDAKLGVAVGTTSLDAVNQVIAPTTEPSIFNSTEDTSLALQNKQVDAIVFDLGSALYVAYGVLGDGVVLGQFSDPTGAGDQFGIVLAKGSELTAPVTAAVDALRDDGTLAELEHTWLAESAGVPVLS